MIRISHQFDSGNIIVEDASKPDNIRLNIRKDNNSDFYQWFHYRVTGAKGEPLTMHIENCGNSAYVDGWDGYHAVASYDREYWFRVHSEFDGERLTIRHTPEFDSVWFAYFAPYSHERHQDLVAEVQGARNVELISLGDTLDGRSMDLLHFKSDGRNAKKLWVIARQHPGETMAEWWMEGFLSRLTDDDDPVARELRQRADFYVVPNMNPDGAFRGHLRTNACGANLNREWETPTMERSPEVFLVLNKMRKTGLDFCLDVHGDEALPFNFIAGGEGTPGWNDDRQKQLVDFKAAYARISPDFQTEKGYAVDAPGEANMTMCTNWTAEEFGGLSMTLEMPFKDTADTPNPETGWSPERCRHLGSAMVDTIWDQFGNI